MNQSILTPPLDNTVLDALGGQEVLKGIVDSGELTDTQYEVLFELYSHEMPYGTQKARTGDPTEWILVKLDELWSRLIPYEEDIKHG